MAKRRLHNGAVLFLDRGVENATESFVKNEQLPIAAGSSGLNFPIKNEPVAVGNVTLLMVLQVGICIKYILQHVHL